MALLKRSAGVPAAITAGGTVPVPAGVQAGDLMFLHALTALATEQNSVPDGWVELAAAHYSPHTPSGHTAGHQIFVRLAGASEPATYTTNWDAASHGYIYAVYSNTSAGVNIASVVATLQGASQTSQVCPTLTFPSAGMRLDFLTFSASFSATAPGGSTEEIDASTGSNRLYLLSEAIAGAGATGTRTVTSSPGCLSKIASLVLVESAYVPVAGPQVRSIAGTNPTAISTATTTHAAPPNINVGDLLVVQVVVSTTLTQVPSISGWTTVLASAQTTIVHYLFTKVAVSGDIGASITINWTSATLRVASVIYAACFSPSGYPVVVHNFVAAALATAATVLDFPTVTTTLANTLLLLWSANEGSTTERMPYAEAMIHHHVSSPKSVLFSAYQAAIGATTAYQGTQGGAGSNQRNAVMALAEVPVPGDPSSLSAVASSSTVIGLTWVDAATNEDNFQLEHSTDGSSWSLLTSPAANATSYNHTGLTEHSIHYYRIRSVNTGGNSGYSNTSSTTTLLVAPTSLVATANGSTTVDLTWTNASGAEDSIRVEQSSNGTSGWAEIYSTASNAVSYSVTGLPDNTTRYWRVRSAAGSDRSTYSNIASATTDDALAAPSSLTLTVLSLRRIKCDWTGNNSDETSTQIERSPNGSTGWVLVGTVGAGVVTFTDTGLTPNVTYYYRVRDVKA